MQRLKQYIGIFSVLLISLLLNVAPASATFSGDNGQILFTKWSTQTAPDGEYNQLDGNVYTADPDGSNEQKQSYLSSLSDFQLSPDGDHVVFSEPLASDSNGYNISISRLDGTEKHTVYTGYFINKLRFLSNGTTIAFNQCDINRNCGYVFTINIDGSNLKQILQGGSGSLSPDGTKDIVVRTDNSGTNSVLGFATGLDGSNPNQTLTDIYSTPGRCTNYCISTPVWSPDNIHVAFWKYVNLDTYNLEILNTATQQVNEYPYSGRPRSTIWSPNGQQILFTSDHSAIKPYYGYPYNPRLLSFNVSSSTFNLLNSSRQADLLDWRAVGNQNTTVFPTITLSNIYRFYSPLINHHLFTADVNEYNYIRANYPSNVWTYETVAFRVNGISNCGANRSVYRFYSELLKTHLYTMDENEKTSLIANYPPSIWRYEGVAYCADKQQVTGTKPVYRFYSEQFKTHLYTMDQNEANYISSHYPPDVYRSEGIAYYAY